MEIGEGLRLLVSCISIGAAVEGEVGDDCREPIFTGLIINLDGSNVGGDICWE